MRKSLLLVGAAFLAALWLDASTAWPDEVEAPSPVPPKMDRSPADLALSPDQRWLLTANQTSDSVSLIDVQRGEVVAELSGPRRPAQVRLTPDGRRALVTGIDSGELAVYSLGDGTLEAEGIVKLRFEPRGIAISPDGRQAYVALMAAHQVAVVDLESLQVRSRIDVEPWPSYLDLTPDGSRLAVACWGSRKMSVVDTSSEEVLYSTTFEGINAGQLRVSPDGKYAYLPYMVYRQNPINDRNIRLGWVLASRIGRVKLDGLARREAMSLDVPGQAVSDPHGLAFTPDERWMVCAASGTHELLVYKHDGELPFMDVGGPGDHIDRALSRDKDRFYRIDLGGRPMGVVSAGDDRRMFVANYLLNCVQIVDLEERAVAGTIELGAPEEPSLARRGEAIFFDGRRSLDQWYSCHSCHYDGGGNAVTMDTHNDGSIRTFKTVLPLHGVTETSPWTWHGWQTDLRDAMRKSLTVTMVGKEPSEEDIDALLAYLETLQPPENPYRNPDGSLTEAALRGKAVFESDAAGCFRCHGGERLTDGEIHDVGLGSPKDAYDGYNTPSLAYLHKKVRWLHHGRAKSLDELLTEYHNPAEVSGGPELTEDERRDLIEYLKSL